MQRWIVAGAVAMMLVLGGGVFAYWTYKQNRPWPVWVPLQINREVPEEKRAEIVKELKAKLSEPDILIKVSKDLNLAQTWKMASDQDAANEISHRLFVRTGETDSPMGRVPSIDVGVQGTKREKALSEKLAMSLMKETWKILGVKQPQGREF